MIDFAADFGTSSIPEKYLNPVSMYIIQSEKEKIESCEELRARRAFAEMTEERIRHLVLMRTDDEYQADVIAAKFALEQMKRKQAVKNANSLRQR